LKRLKDYADWFSLSLGGATFVINLINVELTDVFIRTTKMLYGVPKIMQIGSGVLKM